MEFCQHLKKRCIQAKKRTFECYLEGLWVFKAPFGGVMD